MVPVSLVVRSRVMQGMRAGGGFVEVVVCCVWCIGVVADAPGWAGGGWWCVVLLGVVCWCCHWSPLPWPLGVVGLLGGE